VDSKKIVRIPRPAPGFRLDGWLNELTGIGTFGRDRVMHHTFERDGWLQPQECADLFNHDDICHRVACIYPEEALRRGYKIKGADSERLTTKLDALNFLERVEEGEAWGRAFGGAVGVLFINDGKTPDQPVDASQPYNITAIDLYDRRRVWRRSFFENPTDPLYAHAKIFEITPIYGGAFYVHRDRLLLFRGRKTTDIEREELIGWDASIYQTILKVIRSFQSGYQSVDNMLSDASQSVIKMKGLLGMIGMVGGQSLLATRANLIDLTRSVARTTFLDADAQEEMTKLATVFTGIPDVLDRLGQRLAAAWGIPVTKLLGISAAGLNATGEGEARNWYDELESYRTAKITPHYKKILRILAPERGNEPDWPSLWQPTDEEKASAGLKRAQTYQIYLNEQVVTPAHVAAAEFGPDGPQDLIVLPEEVAFLRGKPMTQPTGPDKPAPAAGAAPTAKPDSAGIIPAIPRAFGDRFDAPSVWGDIREDHIERRGSDYFAVSEEGKPLGGPYPSRKKAAERLREVEAAKAAKGASER
jgi:phage-related protein (TIGR01555 family)